MYYRVLVCIAEFSFVLQGASLYYRVLVCIKEWQSFRMFSVSLHMLKKHGRAQRRPPGVEVQKVTFYKRG